MQETDRTEILNRLKLIEDMIAEGRQTTENWGWAFVLWGIGPLMAMLWETRWPHPVFAWPSVMALCVVVNGVMIHRRRWSVHVKTITMRSVGAVWSSAGVTVVLLAIAAVWSGPANVRALYVAVFALAAVANSASGLILRWLPQFLVALVWWIASLVALVVPAPTLHALAMGALLVGNVAFGAWLMYREWSRGNE